MRKAVIYARVSTDKQDAENQIPEMRALAIRRGFEVGEVYTESESAWKDGHQVELPRLMKDAQRRKFDVVIVWALDRLCRQGSTPMFLTINKLTSCGVAVVSVKEEWLDTAGPLREAFICIFGWIAQFESQRRSERTKAGLAARKAKGVTLGRPTGSVDKKKRVRRWHKRNVLAC